MALELNINPYYDDFDENKNYHKILFKPGYAVQARELTQIQTIIQDQIKKFGKFVLADGSRVSGARIFTDTNVIVVQLVQTENVDLSDILDFNGLYVVAATSKLMGAIVDVDYTNLQLTIKPFNVAGLNNFLSGETLNIFNSKDTAYYYTLNNQIVPNYTVTVATDTTFSVTNASSSKYSLELTVNTLTLQVGDVLSYSTFDKTYTIVEIVDGTTCVVDKAFDSTFTNITLTVTRYASRKSLQVGVDEGIFFTNGYFVKNATQAIVPNTKTQFPSAVIGFEVNETIHDFVDDTSLLDPALGSSNYSAPGADRYVIDLTLVSKPLVGDSLTELTTSKFIELVRIKKGVIIKSNLNPTLGELEKTLARQMYDHAGNYTVKPFTISFSENQLLNSQNTLPLEISAGKAYVYGHEFDIQYPFNMMADKSRATDTTLNYDLSTYYGNSVRIKDIFGSLNFQSSASIELHSTATGQSFSTKIGTAVARNFKYNTTNDYNLYLYDIKLNKATDFANVKSAVITTAANNYSSYTFKANTIQTSNVTILTDSAFQSLVFNLPHNNIKSITNVDFESNLMGTYTFTSNTTSIFSGSLSTQILGGTGTISSGIKKQYFYVTAKQTNGSYTAGQAIDTDDLIISISQTGSEYVASFTNTNGKVYNGSADIWYTVQYNNAQPKLKTKIENQISCVTITNYKTPASLGIADIYSIRGVYKMKSNSMSYKGSWVSANTYYIGNYVDYNNSIYYATNGSTNQNPSSANTWIKLAPNFNNYTLFTGQNDSYYDHGTFTVNSNSDQGSYIVIFDYFTHGSGGYLSQASYPGSVNYADLPSYLTNNKQIVALRDAIDFRPRRQNFSSSLVFDSFSIPATTFSGFNLSYDYYLNRIDKLIVTNDKQFKIVKGIPKYTQFTPPPTPENSMLLATIHYNAYGYSKQDIKIVYENHRRYTMDDIGDLDKRINRVEYYTALSLAESEAINKSTGDELLKSRLRNGFLVDAFSSLTVADLNNIEYHSAIDLQNEVCRPSVIANYIPLHYIMSIDDHGQYITNKLLHFPYEHTSTSSILASNKKATGSINCNPFDVISFAGTLTLSPQSDNWFEINELPDINQVSEDTAALNSALGNPSLVYDSWNLYNSQNNTQKIGSITTVSKGDYTYNIGMGTSTQSKVVEDLRRNVSAFARSIPIQLNASGLSPYTKMYVFVNGELMNGYVSQGRNTTGQITGIKVQNSGVNYTGNTIIRITSGTNTSANATANVTINGQLIDIELTQLGINYTNVSNTQISIIGSGTGAVANVSLDTRNGNDLITDSQGFFNCILQLPCNDAIKFRSGEILISVSDDPIDPKSGSSFAEAIFTSSGDLKVTQNIITSIRNPYITKNYTPVWTPNDDQKPNIIQGQINTNENETVFTPNTFTVPITSTSNTYSSYDWQLKHQNIAGDRTSDLLFYANPGTGNFVNTNFNPSLAYNYAGHGTLSATVRDLNQSTSGTMSFTIPAETGGRIIDPETFNLIIPGTVNTYKPTIQNWVFNATTNKYTLIVKIKDAGEGGNEIYDQENYKISIGFDTIIDPNNPNNYSITSTSYTANNGFIDPTSKTSGTPVDINTLSPEDKDLILRTMASGGTITPEQLTASSVSTANVVYTTQKDGQITDSNGTLVGQIQSNPNTNAKKESNRKETPPPADSNIGGVPPTSSLPTTNQSHVTTAVSAQKYTNLQNNVENTSTALSNAVAITDTRSATTTNLIATAAPASTTVSAITTFQSNASASNIPKDINAAANAAAAAIMADTTLTPKEKRGLIRAVRAEAKAEIKENAKEAQAATAAAILSSVVVKPK